MMTPSSPNRDERQKRIDFRRASGFAAVMRLTIPLSLLALCVAVAGCKSKPATGPEAAPPAQGTAAPKTIIKSADALTGKVVSYNSIGRFVILNFPVTRMPKVGQTMSLYREGLKIGEVKITGPQQDDNIVADLTGGEARAADEVRDN
jgi:hypothetical protein